MNWYSKAFKNYLSFRGRSQRKEYWFFYFLSRFKEINLKKFVNLLKIKE